MKIFLCSIFLIIGLVSFSQSSPHKIDTPTLSSSNTNIPKSTIDFPTNTGKVKYLTSLEYLLSIAVLLFGLIIIGLEIYLVKSNIISSDAVVKFIVVTLIITGTLFLITAGYDNNQIAPAIGLFGTVAGYLLGKSSSNTATNV
jgi:hypothetical protein